MNFPFSTADLQQIRDHGLTESQVQEQLHTFEDGIPIIQITAPATLGDGILHLNDQERKQYIKIYDHTDKVILKFVPASGAATRMFKLLHEFDATFNPSEHNLHTFLKKAHFSPFKLLFDQFENLPFSHRVLNKWKQAYPGHSVSTTDMQKYNLIHFLLNQMDYPSRPKGLIPFHRYRDKSVTAFEEHFKEAAAYGHSDRPLQIHFTVSEEHLELFKSTFRTFRPKIEDVYSTFEVSYSFQNKSTDTIAVREDNNPFRDKNGRLFFRPGGHGALIQNLNEIDADLIFIKNVDNVVTDKDLPLMAAHKKVLGGVLLTVQDKIFSILREMEKNGFSKELQNQAIQITESYFGLRKTFRSADEIKTYFDRPIRVCGMVENKGDPGGGPFWVKEKTRGQSLQIVENAQIDKTDKSQAEIMQGATHFNPVDLVCGVKDYKDNKFDLYNFINAEEGFISHKSKDGAPLKALELPGLWNGAMAYWNTIFVEVPLKTFNPVKTVIDLLKPGHQVD